MKIKGLSAFHKKALSCFLKQHGYNLNDEVEVNFTETISLGQLHCLWYGGSVAEVKYKGYTFSIDAIGDVYANLYTARKYRHLEYLKDKSNNGVFASKMRQYFRSDKTLLKIIDGNHRKYSIDLLHNNWWECGITDPQGNWHDIMWVTDDDNLFSAILEVLTSLDETIEHINAA